MLWGPGKGIHIYLLHIHIYIGTLAFFFLEISLFCRYGPFDNTVLVTYCPTKILAEVQICLDPIKCFLHPSVLPCLPYFRTSVHSVQ